MTCTSSDAGLCKGLLIAWQPIVAAKRVATLDGATDLSSVRLKDGSFRPVFGLNPPDLAVHMLARAERCGAVLLMGWGGGGQAQPWGVQGGGAYAGFWALPFSTPF